MPAPGLRERVARLRCRGERDGRGASATLGYGLSIRSSRARDNRLVEIFAVAIGVGFIILGLIYVRGSKMPADPHPNHIEFVERLSERDLVAGYNETLVGITCARDFGHSADRSLAEIEIARSFYVQLMKTRGMPVTVGEKAKLKRRLAVLAAKARHAASSIDVRTSDQYHSLRVEQDFDDVMDFERDRTQLDEACASMRRALGQ